VEEIQALQQKGGDLSLDAKRSLFFRYKDILRERLHLEKVREKEDIRNEAFWMMDRRMPHVHQFRDVWDDLNRSARLREALSDDAKLEIFEDFMEMKIKDDKMRQHDTTKRHKDRFFDSLMDLRKSGDLGLDALWKNVEQKLKNFEQYRNLDQLDRLEIWIYFIEKINKDHDRQHEEELKFMYPTHLKNRTNFWQLLIKMRQEGKITRSTQWDDIIPHLQHTDEFKQVHEQYGPKPIDLFEEYRADLHEEFQEQLAQVDSILSRRSAAHKPSPFFSEHTSLEEFLSAIQEGQQGDETQQLNVEILKEVYISKREHVLQLKHQQAREDFLQMLQEHISSIGADILYDTVATILADKPAFKAIEEESERQHLFTQHKEALKRKEMAQEDSKKRKRLHDDSVSPSMHPEPKRSRMENHSSDSAPSPHTVPTTQPKSNFASLLKKVKGTLSGSDAS